MMSSNTFQPTCLNSKVAIITGGGSGIGFIISEQLLSHGCSGIIIAGRRTKVLKASAESLGNNCLYKKCDVRNYSDCESLVKYAIDNFGRLDILVNSAAGNFLANASSLSSKGFRTVMEIDALGTFHMCRAAYPHLRDSSHGVIVNISMTLHYGATWYQCHASAAKSAVDSLTRSLALEWGTDGIRVVGIAPGPIQNTPGTAKLSAGMDDIVKESVPLKNKMGEAIDVAYAAIFLCSDAAKFITGDTLIVDGANWLYKPQLIPREMVAKTSKSLEKKSRDMIIPSKL